jgi:hypothetical protein
LEGTSLFQLESKEKVFSYAIALKTDAEIYSGYIHHKYNDNMMSSNFIKFISIDPLNAFGANETRRFFTYGRAAEYKKPFNPVSYNYAYRYQYR